MDWSERVKNEKNYKGFIKSHAILRVRQSNQLISVVNYDSNKNATKGTK